MSLPEYTIDAYETKSIVETNHFLIQTVRIPTTEKPSLRKIMQVALNIGQYQAENGKLLSRTECGDYVLQSTCNTNIENVLDAEQLKKLMKILSKE